MAEANRLSAMYERLSGGNPLLVNALLEDRLGGADSTAMPPPAQAYRHAVVTCLQRSDELTAQVARGLAALDLSRATRLVGRLLSLEHEAVQRCKHVLRLTGLLDQTGFRHPETRAAVLDSLAPDRRSALHLQVARLLFSEGAAAAEVAKHLLAADDAGETWAPGLLLEASAQALHEDRTDLAARYARLARSGTLNEEERVAVTFMLAQVDGRVNPVASVRHFSSLLDALTEGQLHFDQAIDLVKHLLWHGQLEQAEEALRYVARIRKDADATEPPEWEAFRLWLGCTYPALARNVSDALDPQGADAPPRHTADPHVQAAWLLNGVLRGRLSQLDIAAVQEHLQPLRLSETTYEPLAMTLTALVYADRHETAAAWGELLLKDARDREVPSWKATLSSITAEAAMRCGDPEVAEDHARATLRWGLGVEHATASLLLALVARGALEEAGRLLGRPVRNSAPHTPADLYYRHARGHYYLAINRPLAALAEFETCGRSARSWEMDLPSFVPWRSDTAQALVALGREKEAGDLVNEQLSLLTSAQGRTRALTLRVLAGASAPENRVPLLLEALECLRDDPDRVERCRVLGLLGHAYHAQGDPTEGRRWIRQARDLARECKADGLLTALNLVGEPERETVQDRDGAVGIEDLSKAEQRVALLVSRGHTNSEIAGKLFITVSTVEQHLTRIYRKLGIKHRSGLRSMYEGVVAPC
ncbi:helix-turn-helix transcriptional regulator [Streptomyces sp. I05A-00742]|uniref:helix-turn-helix transcriptional regulator n=1 Tax=Streptomyces sp. I05A-00742 TaxID=2732853 RepID=UPI00289E925F|nr:helix-turn-helix transcriptional regulator [Streptomyces sp. I05A-00742]